MQEIASLGCVAVEVGKNLRDEAYVEYDGWGIRITRPPGSKARIGSLEVFEDFGNFGIGRNRDIRNYRTEENENITRLNGEVVKWYSRQTEKYPFGLDKVTKDEFEKRKVELSCIISAFKIAQNEYILYVFFYHIFFYIVFVVS